jgi:hypothetical protein
MFAANFNFALTPVRPGGPESRSSAGRGLGARTVTVALQHASHGGPRPAPPPGLASDSVTDRNCLPVAGSESCQ